MIIFCAVFFSTVLANESPASRLGVSYQCQGEDFLNRSTFDEPTRLTKTGTTYSFVWMNKQTAFYGTSILLDDTLSSVFWTPKEPTLAGLVTYKILPNGDLKGRWTIKGSQISGDEYCKKLK